MDQYSWQICQILSCVYPFFFFYLFCILFWCVSPKSTASLGLRGGLTPKLKVLLLLHIAFKYYSSWLWLSWSPFTPGRLVKNNICITITDLCKEQHQGDGATALVQLGPWSWTQLELILLGIWPVNAAREVHPIFKAWCFFHRQQMHSVQQQCGL